MVERLEEVDLEEADLEEVDLVVVLRALALPVDRLAALVGVFFRITSPDRKSTRLNSSHSRASRMPSSA